MQPNSDETKKAKPFDPLDTSHEHLVLQKLQRVNRLDPSDRTAVHCDICCVDPEKIVSLGGVVLKEIDPKLGKYTMACQSCFEDFICASPEIQQELSKQPSFGPAFRTRVGIDSEEHLQLDRERSFFINVLMWRQDNPLQSQFKAIIRTSKFDLSNADSDVTDEASIKGSFKMSCNGCKLFKDECLLKKCMRCLLARYCSKQCQIDDWIFHKQLCQRLEIARKNQAYHQLVQQQKSENEKK
jgi:hypothetical protein